MSEKHKDAGRRGGLATLARYGSGHFADIGRRGAAAFWLRYTLLPYGVGGYLIVTRAGGHVIARR